MAEGRRPYVCQDQCLDSHCAHIGCVLYIHLRNKEINREREFDPFACR